MVCGDAVLRAAFRQLWPFDLRHNLIFRVQQQILDVSTQTMCGDGCVLTVLLHLHLRYTQSFKPHKLEHRNLILCGGSQKLSLWRCGVTHSYPITGCSRSASC